MPVMSIVENCVRLHGGWIFTDHLKARIKTLNFLTVNQK